MPKYFTQEEREQIRASILEVGLALIEKYGIDKTTIKDITDRVGISKASFYSFFNSKSDVYIEIYRIEREKANRRSLDTISEEVCGLTKRLMRYGYEMARRMEEQPLLRNAYDPISMKMASDKSVRERLLQYNADINAEMTNTIQHWMDQEGSYSIDARIVAKMLRSIDFLRFHDQAIGLDDFDAVVETMYLAVCEKVASAKIL